MDHDYTEDLQRLGLDAMPDEELAQLQDYIRAILANRRDYKDIMGRGSRFMA